MNIIPISILIISLFFAFKYPKYFIYLFVISSTKFFGFLDVEKYSLIAGVNYYYALLCIIPLIVLVIKKNHFKFKTYNPLVLCYIGLFLLGLLRAIFIYEADIKSTILVSKEFFSVFFLLYLLNFKRNISIVKLINFTITIGLILSLIFIIYKLFYIYPPAYKNGDNIRVFFPSYISLAYFLVYYKLLKSLSRFKNVVYLVILFFGLALCDYDSLLIMANVAICSHFLILRNSNYLFSLKSLWKSVFLIIVFCLLIFSTTYLNKISSFISEDNTAVSSRIVHNAHRINAIGDSFYWGYGFLHEDSEKAKEYIVNPDNNFQNSLGVIDSGYIDLLIKFGIIGSLFFLIIILKYLLTNLNKHNTRSLEFISTIFIFHFLFVNYTWSVFTYRHGLIPFFIVLLFLDKRSTSNKFNKI
jgi:hypothetical protein